MSARPPKSRHEHALADAREWLLRHETGGLQSLDVVDVLRELLETGAERKTNDRRAGEAQDLRNDLAYYVDMEPEDALTALGNAREDERSVLVAILYLLGGGPRSMNTLARELAPYKLAGRRASLSKRLLRLHELALIASVKRAGRGGPRWALAR